MKPATPAPVVIPQEIVAVPSTIIDGSNADIMVHDGAEEAGNAQEQSTYGNNSNALRSGSGWQNSGGNAEPARDYEDMVTEPEPHGGTGIKEDG